MKKRGIRTFLIGGLIGCLPACAGFKTAICGTHAMPPTAGHAAVAEKHGMKDGLKDIVGGIGGLVGPGGSLVSAAFGFGIDLFCKYAVEKPIEGIEAIGSLVGIEE
jgi:hypothetical protein